MCALLLGDKWLRVPRPLVQSNSFGAKTRRLSSKQDQRMMGRGVVHA